MKSQDVFSPNRQIETFVLYNCSRKAPDIQGFFPMLRTAFLLCCYKHTLFSRFPHSIYRRQSSSRRDHTRRLFAARKTERRFSLWYSELRQGNGQKSKPLCAGLAVTATRVTACCWMTLKCSAEPKCRDVAQIAVFSAEAEPFWLRNKMYPQGQESGLRHRAAQRYAEISVSDSRFSLCPAGGVLWYSKQGLCVPQKSQSQPKSADSLGA